MQQAPCSAVCSCTRADCSGVACSWQLQAVKAADHACAVKAVLSIHHLCVQLLGVGIVRNISRRCSCVRHLQTRQLYRICSLNHGWRCTRADPPSDPPPSPWAHFSPPQTLPVTLHLSCRYIHYVSKLPESQQAFEEQLAQFYAKHGAILTPPSILQIPLDCYIVFNAVAERGGYEGVSGTRHVELNTCICFTHLAVLVMCWPRLNVFHLMTGPLTAVVSRNVITS